MSSLQAYYAGAFSPNPLTTTTLGDVLLDGNVASTDILMNTNDITGAGTVSAVTVTASGAVTGASMATQTLNASSNITTSGSVILTQTNQSISNNAGALILGTSAISTAEVKGSLKLTTAPLECNYPSFTGGSILSVGYVIDSNIAISVPLTIITSTWTLLYQSPLIIPLGVWLLTARVGFVSSDPLNTSCNVYFGTGSAGLSVIPVEGGTGAIQTNKGYVNYTTVFQSANGFQSPTFSYKCDVANLTTFGLAYQLIRIG